MRLSTFKLTLTDAIFLGTLLNQMTQATTVVKSLDEDHIVRQKRQNGMATMQPWTPVGISNNGIRLGHQFERNNGMNIRPYIDINKQGISGGGLDVQIPFGRRTRRSIININRLVTTAPVSILLNAYDYYLLIFFFRYGIKTKLIGKDKRNWLNRINSYLETKSLFFSFNSAYPHIIIVRDLSH